MQRIVEFSPINPAIGNIGSHQIQPATDDFDTLCIHPVEVLGLGKFSPSLAERVCFNLILPHEKQGCPGTECRENSAKRPESDRK